jgi:hypothetical protein
MKCKYGYQEVANKCVRQTGITKILPNKGFVLRNWDIVGTYSIPLILYILLYFFVFLQKINFLQIATATLDQLRVTALYLTTVAGALLFLIAILRSWLVSDLKTWQRWFALILALVLGIGLNLINILT